MRRKPLEAAQSHQRLLIARQSADPKTIVDQVESDHLSWPATIRRFDLTGLEGSTPSVPIAVNVPTLEESANSSIPCQPRAKIIASLYESYEDIQSTE